MMPRCPSGEHAWTSTLFAGLVECRNCRTIRTARSVKRERYREYVTLALLFIAATAIAILFMAWGTHNFPTR